MQWFDRWRSTITITITVDASRATCRKGKVSHPCLADVASAFRHAGLTNGEIYLTADGRLDFSADIPARHHQQIRNVVLGHHNPS